MNRSNSKSNFSQPVMNLLRTRLRLPVNLLMLGCTFSWTFQGSAAVLIKTYTGPNTVIGLATVGGVTSNFQNVGPTASDTLLFNNLVLAAATYRLSNVTNTTVSLQGLTIHNPGGAITLQNFDNQSQTLSLGSGGIDMSRANQNLTISNATGGTATLALANAGAGTWNVAAGRTLTVSSIITGSGTGLTINPGLNGLGGIVTLSGANTFTGATTVTNATLNLDYASNASRIHSGSGLSLTRATVNLQGGSTTTQVVNGLTLGSGLNQVTRSGSHVLDVGAITRSSANALLNVGASGAVITSTANANGMLGGWAVVNKTDWATVAAGGGVVGAYSTYTTKTGAWTAPGTTANVRIDGTVTGVTSGTINSLKFNTGAFNLTQAAGSTLNIASGGILKNDNNATTISGGTITAGGAADGTADTLYVWQNSNTMVVSSVLANNGTDVVNLVKAGDATLRFDNTTAHSMTGSVTIAGGRILIGNNNATGFLPGTSVVFAAAPGAANGTGTDDGMLVYNRNDSGTWTHNFTGMGGDDLQRHAIRKSAGSSTTLTLAPTVANTYGGSTYIQAGTIAAGNAQALSPNSRFHLANTAQVTLNLNNFSNTIRGLTGGGTTGGNVSLGTATLTLAPIITDAFSYGGVISGTGGLIKEGDGSQTFTAAQTFSGPLTMDGGLLQGTSLSPSSVTVNAGTLQASVRITTGAVTVANGILRAPTLVGGPVNITGSGSFIMEANSSLPANATVNLTGAGGSMQVNNGSNYSIGSFLSGANTSLLMQGGSGNTSLTFNDVGSLDFQGFIGMDVGESSGLANVVKAGSSTWTLSGGNAYNGATSINGGIVRVAAGASVEVLPDLTALALGNTSGVAFDLNGKRETIGSLAGGGTTGGNVLLGTGTLTAGGNGASTTYAGVISGTGGFVKTGDGTLTLTGANTFSGPLTISGGGVVLAHSGGNALSDNGSLRLAGYGTVLTVTGNETLGRLTTSANSVVHLSPGATLTTAHGVGDSRQLTANLDSDTRVVQITAAEGTANLAPGMTISGEGVPAGAYISQILNQNQVLISHAVTSDATGNYTFGEVDVLSGAFTGSGNWTKTGTGIAVLTGHNTLSGTMTIADGTIQIGGVNIGGRNIIQDVLSNAATLVFNTAAGTNPTLNFLNTGTSPTATVMPLTPFERIGALSGGSNTAVINLGTSTDINTSSAVVNASSAILAVGANNQSTSFTGAIRGGNGTIASGRTAMLIKEGNGVFDWTSNAADTINGAVRVEGGGLIIRGSEGLDSESNVVLGNAAGTTLTVSTTGTEAIEFLTGGGRGATRAFTNGANGALLGGYLNGTGGQVVLNSNLTLNSPIANAVYVYGGSITGAGGLVKDGNNVFEVRGPSSYTGNTTIRSLADTTTSTIRLGAYGSGAGVGNAGTSGYGSLSPATNLRLENTAGVNRNATLDLNGGSQTLNSLTTTGTTSSGARSILFGGGTLTINASSTGQDSGTFEGIFSGRGTLNISATKGASGWTLSGNSNFSQTGNVNITGGRLNLGRAGGALGDSVSVHVAPGGTLAVSNSDTVGTLTGTGAVVLTQTLTLSTGALGAGAPGSVATNTSWLGTTSGAGGLTLASGGNLRVGTNQGYQGATTLNTGSVLWLDYSASHTNLVPGQLVLNGGSVYLKGNSQADSASHVSGQDTVIGAGGALIAAPSNAGVSDSSRFGLGNIQRERGGVLQIKGSAASTSTAVTALGTLGGYATYGNGPYVTTWAVPMGSGASIEGLDIYSDSWGSNLNTDVLTDMSVGGDTGSVRFNQPVPLTLSLGEGEVPTLIESGGILVTRNVGANDVRIEDVFGVGLLGGNGDLIDELIIHQHNPLGSLTIDANILDQGLMFGDDISSLRFTKAGQGKVILTQDNAFNGETSILAGVLQLGDGGFFGGLGPGVSSIYNYGTLAINRQGTLTLAGNIEGTGSLRIQSSGTSGLTLVGANSRYSGAVSVLGGTLRVNSTNTGLGTTAGLTSVATSGTLLLANATLAETVVLRGGTLATSGASPVNLSGPVIVTSNSRIKAESPMTLSGPLIVQPGKTLTFATPGASGVTILANASNQIGAATIEVGAKVQIGNNTSGSFGRGPILNNGELITNTNNAHLVVGAPISGSGAFRQWRNNVYLTGNNTYTGSTYVDASALGATTELRVGNDTYSGSIGTGSVLIQSGTGATANMRTLLVGDTVLANNFIINPNSTGTNAINSTFVRAGLGSVTLTGTVTAGAHNISGGTNLQRAQLQTDGGGKLIIAATINNGTTNRLNLVNNGIMEFIGSISNTYHGVVSGGGIFNFNNSGTTTLTGVNSFNTSHTFVQRGTLVFENDAGTAVWDDTDLYALRGATVEFNFGGASGVTETIGALFSQTGGVVRVASGNTLVIDDNTNQAQFGTITGNGNIVYSATGGAAWHGLYADSDYGTDPLIGSSTQIAAVRVNNLPNGGLASPLGAGYQINLGMEASGQETRLEYVGAGNTTDRLINLSGGASTVRIVANGSGGLVFNNDVAVTSAGNKTLVLQGQTTMGNAINGIINQGSTVLTLSVNPKVADNDLYGASKWTLTNSNNNFSGGVSVGVGTLELNGDLKTGSATTSVLGNLAVARTIDLGTNDFNGRRYDISGGTDNIGAGAGLTSTGTLIFNDPNSGTATFGSNITFTQSFNSTTNPGGGELVNNGAKVIVINGNLTSGATGNRNWILDGTNTGINSLNGVISNGSGGAVVSILKEGAGTWKLGGQNTFTGSVTIARGTLEITGGNSIGNSAIVNLSNAGSDGSSVGSPRLHVLQSETIGRLQGAIGSVVDIATGQVLTLTADADAFNGIITGGGGFTRSDNGAARVTTFTNLNTYTGPTSVISAGNQASRIDVLTLADGDLPSSIGSSSNAASNLVLSTGTVANGGGLRWIGANDQSTDRLFTIGAGAGAAAIWTDGQTFGDYVPRLHFSNTGAIGFIAPNTAQTLILRGSNLGDNQFDPKITNNGTGVTSLTKTEPSVWLLTNHNTYTGTTTVANGTLGVLHNSALGTGGVNVTGSSAGVQLRGGVTVNNALTNSASNGGIASASGTNTWAGAVTLAGSNANWRVGANENATLNFSNVIGGTVGSGRFIKYDRGTVILSGTNSYQGITSISGGRMVLNFDTTAGGSDTTKLANAQALEFGFAGGLSGIITGLGAEGDVANQLYTPALGGGTLVLSGGTHVEVVSSTIFNNGANRIIREGGSAVLQMGAITRGVANAINDYGTVEFGTPGIATTTTLNSAGGILAPNSAFATVALRDWAVTGTSGTNAVTALSSYANDTFGSTLNTNVVSANLTTPGAVTSHTLRFGTNNGGETSLVLGGTLGLETGGILVSADVTDNVTISGAAIQRSATTANLDTVVHHHGSGTLTIASILANNSGAQAFTKTGNGTVVLTAANTFTGRISIQQGVLEVGNGTTATANARLGTGVISMSENATLRINVANAALEYNSAQWSGGGSLELASTNTSTFLMDDDNNNWVGNITVGGGTLRIRGNANALGNLRGTTTINGGGTLNISGGSTLTFAERITMNEGAVITATANGTTNTASALSGVLTLNNITSAGAVFDIGVSATGVNQTLTLTNMIRTSHGFTKMGNGILTVSANQMQGFLPGAAAGATTPNMNSALLGNIVVAQGELRAGNPRALGATGVANAVIVLPGATLDLRGQSLNYADDPDPFRKVIRVAGDGLFGTGALRNSSGLGAFSHLIMDADATIGGGGYANSSRLVLGSYDINPNTGSVLDGNITRVRAKIDGNGFDLNVRTNAVSNDANGAGVTMRDPDFSSALNSITVSEGVFRIEKEFGPVTAFNGLTPEQITNGIRIAYAGASLGDQTNAALGLGPNVGARFNLWNNWDLHHTVDITMDGAVAMANNGVNYIDTGVGTIPSSRVYLDGRLTLTGNANRNILHNDSALNTVSVVDQGNLTVSLQSKMMIGGQIVGDGGFTKTGFRELRLTNNNTFTGDVNVLRFGSSALGWQTNTVTVNGVEYETYGDAEGWAEWGLTLAGQDATLAGTGNINLQRRGMLTLDNTTRLDLTSGVTGGNNNNRINDAANILLNHGWLRINGGGTDNLEELATAPGASMQILSGTNILDLWPTDGAGTEMTLTIGRLTRESGAILRIQNLDATSTFSTVGGPESVRVKLNDVSGLTQVGAGTSATNKSVVIGVLGGTMPHTYLQDVRTLGYNNANVSDYLNQGRNQQFLAGSHFMTYDGGYLRPLDDSEYFIPQTGLIEDSLAGGAGQNVNLTDAFTTVRQDTAVNTLRFGPLADNDGSGGAMNDKTVMTGYIPSHSIQLYVDGTLSITSGMISSAYFTVGNATSLSTLTVGGTLDFGSREAIINNQNGAVNLTGGTINTGNLEIRSNIAGTGGLLKTGLAQVVLDGRNTYSGVTTINDGVIFLRNGRHALGAAGLGNGVVIEGNGNLNSGNGIQVGSPTGYETILIKALQGDQQILRVDNDLTNWFANIIIDNVDAAGQTIFTPRIRTDASATSILNGNISGGFSAITSDVAAIDSRVVQFDSAGNNSFIFRGQFGDRVVNTTTGEVGPIANPIWSQPTTASRTNENEVLRVNLVGGSDETVFTFDRNSQGTSTQYNAAGRLTIGRGTVFINYDPTLAANDGSGFWTAEALSKIPNADSTTTSFAVNGVTSHQGFVLGNTSNTYTGLLMTTPGQWFNMSSWSTVGSGVKVIGGFNDSGTVTFGDGKGSLVLSGASSRLHAASGGTVVFDQRLTGNAGTAPNNFGFIKIGRGTVELKNTSVVAASDSNFELGGGTLVLDYTGQNFSAVSPFGMMARVGSGNAAFGGGVITTVPNASAPSSVGYAVTNGVNSVLQFRLGNSEIISQADAQNMKVAMGSVNANNNTATVTRALGSTANLVEATSGAGTAQILLNFNAFTTAVNVGRAISWATYSNTPGTASDFAMTQADGFTFTGTINSGSTTINSIPAAQVVGLLVGMPVIGPNIPLGATIASISGTTSITISVAATATTSGATITVPGDVRAFARAPEEYVNNVSGWAAGMDVSEQGGAGFFGTLGSNLSVNTVRFNTAAEGSFSLGNSTLTVAGDGVAGAILFSSNTGNANKTITGGSLTTTAPDLIFHHYGKGIVTVDSKLTGSNGVTITGPNTTNPSQFNTTGTVRFTGTNTYTGRTIITGGVLEVANTAALGANPASVANDHLTLNGGTFRWTGGTSSLGNRGIRFEGNGGVIEVVDPNAKLIVGSDLAGTQAQISSQDIYRGDLIKTGAGNLTFQGSSTTHNNGFLGLIDVRQGSLSVMVDVGNASVTTTSILGSNRSWADGTIFRPGTSFHTFLGNGNADNAQNWNIEEFFTFEGNNTFTHGGFLEVNTNLSTGAALDGQLNLGNRRILNLNGPISLSNDPVTGKGTTFDVGLNSFLRLNNGSGYLTGSGDIIKDGQGQLEFRANVPDWTGNLVIKQGSVYAINQADVLGTGALFDKKITLGDADRAGVAQLLIQNPDGVQNWIFEINHDIDVVYNPAQTKRLGIDNIANGNLVSYNGDITLNDNLVMLLRDVGISVGGEQAVVNFNGSLKDGAITSGNILFQTDDTDTSANNLVSSRTYGYGVLNGDNSAWTGDVQISNNAVFNQDNTTIVRMGHTKALTAANDVTMGYNSILQAGGQAVTIGSLTTLGGTGGYYGDAGTMSASSGGSSEIIENAASTPGTFTIAQATPASFEAAWDAKFRDGTLNSQFHAPGANTLNPSAALNIVKAGTGWATLTLDNDHSGTTTVSAGVLQVGRNSVGDTGVATARGTIVLSGGTLAGTGTVQGRGATAGQYGLDIRNSGLVSPGDQAGSAMGTLTVNADAIFATGSQALLQVRVPTYNNAGVLDTNDEDYVNWKNGIMTDEFSYGLQEQVTSSQHDQLNVLGTINWTLGTKVTVENQGYTPKAGDIFRLFNATSFVGGINVGSTFRTGAETNTDLTLFALGGNFRWDTSRFNSDGLLLVVSAETESTIFPPVINGTITSTPAISPGTKLDPNTNVTLSISASVSGGTLSYQWRRKPLGSDLGFEPISGATSSSYSFTANSFTKGQYDVVVSSDGGFVQSSAITVDVNDLPEITLQPSPSSKTINPGDSIAYTADASGPEPLTFQWQKKSGSVWTNVLGATSKTFSIASVTKQDEGSYRMVVTNPGGSVNSNQVTFTVRDPVTNVVASRTIPAAGDVFANERVELRVTAQGTPLLKYQWRKDGTDIAGAVGAVYAIPSAKTSDSGQYDVMVRNDASPTPVASNVISLNVMASSPEFAAPLPKSQTLLVGQQIVLDAVVLGRPTLSYQWKKNKAVIAAATNATAITPNFRAPATIANAGIYTLEASNTVKATSPDAHVVVVEDVEKVLPVAVDGTVTMTVNVGAAPTTPLTFQWYKDGIALVAGADSRLPVVNTKALKITKAKASDTGVYTCRVQGPAAESVFGGTHTLKVFSQAPELLKPFTPDDAVVGGNYYYEVPYVGRGSSPDDAVAVARTPSAFAASGLPPGLKIDAAGNIVGRPTAFKPLSKDNGQYKVVITISNSKGKDTYNTTIFVRPLPDIAGSYAGPIERHALNGGLGGRFEMTVASTAAVTGKLTLGAATYPMTGTVDIRSDGGAPTALLTAKRPGTLKPLTVTLALDADTGLITDGTISETEENSTTFTGWRQIWSPSNLATQYQGLYTFALERPADLALDPKIPQGNGYGAFTVATNGKLSIAGKTADGEKITSATFLGPQGQVLLFQTMYTTTPKGSLSGHLIVSKGLDETSPLDNTIGPVTRPEIPDEEDPGEEDPGEEDPGEEDPGEEDPGSSELEPIYPLTWLRPANLTPKARTYQQGFGPIELTPVGSRYEAPAAGEVALKLPEGGTAILEFFDGGLDVAGPDANDNPNVTVSIAKGNKATVISPTDPVLNPAKVSLTLSTVPTKGEFTGTFTLSQANPRTVTPTTPPVIDRKVTFQGIIIKDAASGEWVGYGHFLMAQLPDNQTLVANTAILSGQVVFRKADPAP